MNRDRGLASDSEFQAALTELSDNELKIFHRLKHISTELSWLSLKMHGDVQFIFAYSIVGVAHVQLCAGSAMIATLMRDLADKLPPDEERGN
jgi:hypothetical protein